MFIRLSQSYIFLFKQWQVKTAEGAVLAAVVSFLVAVCFEVLDAYVRRSEHTIRAAQNVQRGQRHQQRIRCNSRRIFLSLVYLMLRLLLYLLMLIAMTYDVIMLTAVITGSGLGYFLTDNWKRNHRHTINTISDPDNNEWNFQNETTSDNQFTLPLILTSLSKDIPEIRETNV